MARLVCIFVLFLSLGCGSFESCYRPPQTANDPDLPKKSSAQEVEFLKPDNQAVLDYLGLETNGKTFTLSQIKTDVLVVEIFSMDCPHCQGQAPHMNDLYNLIAQKGWAGKIKIIGFGMTNSDFGVRIYQKKFNVLFPLIADPDNKSHKVTGRVEIPAVCIFKRDREGSMQMISSKSRDQRSAEAIFEDVILANLDTDSK